MRSRGGGYGVLLTILHRYFYHPLQYPAVKEKVLQSLIGGNLPRSVGFFDELENLSEYDFYNSIFRPIALR